MKLKLSVLFLLFTLLLGLCVFLFLAKRIASTPKQTIIINHHTFFITVAKSNEEKTVGLSHQLSLAQDQGMLFPFDTAAYYTFWMKDMKFSIDIIFIANNRIVTIYHSVPYPKDATQPLPIYQSSQPADMVLELSAGITKKYTIQEGDLVQTNL